LNTARARLGVLEARTHRLAAERAVIGGELALAGVDRRLALDHVASRLRYLYDYGATTNSLDVVLGSSSLEQALTRLDDVNEVDAANQSVILQLRSAQARFTVLSAELAAREQALAQTTSAVAATVSDLGQLQAQQTAYITGLENQKAYDDGEIARLTAEAQAAAARALLLARERAAAEAAQRQRATAAAGERPARRRSSGAAGPRARRRPVDHRRRDRLCPAGHHLDRIAGRLRRRRRRPLGDPDGIAPDDSGVRRRRGRRHGRRDRR
jgi:septal ring factor EnvC (AmiA/AmiB activator)